MKTPYGRTRQIICLSARRRRKTCLLRAPSFQLIRVSGYFSSSWWFHLLRIRSKRKAKGQKKIGVFHFWVPSIRYKMKSREVVLFFPIFFRPRAKRATRGKEAPPTPRLNPWRYHWPSVGAIRPAGRSPQRARATRTRCIHPRTLSEDNLSARNFCCLKTRSAKPGMNEWNEKGDVERPRDQPPLPCAHQYSMQLFLLVSTILTCMYWMSKLFVGLTLAFPWPYYSRSFRRSSETIQRVPTRAFDVFLKCVCATHFNFSFSRL